ncbi:hypothetical protein BD408DRAFT_425129 [Parasitella parasitica]|nr:hypothetical protein BD408DRAFT_425129 [Parasitella parasitica]
MASSSKQVINNELFRLYTEYLVCQVRKSAPSFWKSDEAEKNALIEILTQFQHVDANVLRMVVDEIFENSVEKFSQTIMGNIVNDKVSEIAAEKAKEPATDYRDRAPKVIANTSNNDSDSSLEEDNNVPSPVHTTMAVADASDKAAISKRNIIHSSTAIQTRSRKRKHSISENPNGCSLSRPAKKEIEKLVSDVENTKVMLRQRMKSVGESFSVNPTSANIIQNATPSVFTISNWPKESSNTKIFHKCQENFIAFRFGKLVERLRRKYPAPAAIQRERQYQEELQRELIRRDKTFRVVYFYAYESFCRRVVHIVNENGLYCLFIPEILSPSTLRKGGLEEFAQLSRYMNEKCSVFNNVGKTDSYGKFVTVSDVDPSTSI